VVSKTWEMGPQTCLCFFLGKTSHCTLSCWQLAQGRPELATLHLTFRLLQFLQATAERRLILRSFCDASPGVARFPTLSTGDIFAFTQFIE